ncbi:MAG: ImmA/IrrE family metallo-endopeptidase, partial [Acidobacteriota bacterium]|nr:ImmA/IrrE family metallo-endopeptidase [Acidobacteriota bacterium]
FTRTSWRWRVTATLAFALALLLSAPIAAQQTQSPKPPAVPKAQKHKPQISAREAEELLRSVDQILKFASEDTRLPIRQPVKRRLASSDEVKQFFADRLREDKETQRMERAEAVLKKLGFLPRQFDLRSFFLDMLDEQVAGFYDEHTRTVYLLDWVEPGEQRAVLAHELTHALQDQALGLEKWAKAAESEEDVVEKKPKKSEEGDFEVQPEEAAMARTALLEGQAMFVLIDYLYAPVNRSLATDPLLAAPFREASTDSPQYPVLKNAPLYLKESLTFPYTFGLEFVQELLLKGGKAQAFAGALKDPPRNSRDIMTPRSYFSRERIPALWVPALKPLLGPGYERFDVGSIGQFDVYALLEQFADLKTAKRLSPAWRGGFYYAALRLPEKDAKNAAAAKPEPPAPGAGDPATREPDAKDEQGRPHPVGPESLALVYLSRWDSPESAAKFASFYAGGLLQRYRFAQGEDAPSPKAPVASVASSARKKWTTEDGPVFIEQRGEWVLVLESFDEATAGKLADAILAGAKTVPAKP